MQITDGNWKFKEESSYGWILVGISFLSMAFWMGIRSSFSVFYATLLDEFQWSRASTAFVQSITFVMYMVSVPFIGGAIDRFGPRFVILPGIILLAIGLMLSSTVKSLFEFYLYYGIIVGIGTACVSIVPYSAILAHWFEKRRGLASGIASSGMGFGTFSLLIISEALISTHGWREAFFVLGLLALILLFPTNGFLLKHKPENRASSPRSPKEQDSAKDSCEKTKLKKVLLSNQFLMCVAFGSLVLLSVHVILVHSVRIFMDQGISLNQASSALAIVGVVSSLFRVLWGWLSDWKGRKVSYTMGASFLILSGVSLFLTQPEREWLIYIFVFSFSAGWGVTAPSFMAILADLFKGERFGAIYGFFEAAIYGLSVLGVWAVGLIYDLKGTYWPNTFIVISGSVIASILIIWLIRNPYDGSVKIP